MAKQQSKYNDERLQALRDAFEALRDDEHALFHQGYHKSQLKFYGLKTPVSRKALTTAFPKRQTPERDELIELVKQLWASPYWEERMAAIELLSRRAGELTLSHLPWLKELTRGCEGWAQLDTLACRTLGEMALVRGEAMYRKVFAWRKDAWMWTRRASVLIHLMPSRKSELFDETAWDTFASLLPEDEFFIRKAIGWTLREISKHYPAQVVEFLNAHDDAVSGLTFREGSRNLPDAYKRKLKRS